LQPAALPLRILLLAVTPFELAAKRFHAAKKLRDCRLMQAAQAAYCEAAGIEPPDPFGCPHGCQTCLVRPEGGGPKCLRPEGHDGPHSWGPWPALRKYEPCPIVAMAREVEDADEGK